MRKIARAILHVFAKLSLQCTHLESNFPPHADLIIKKGVDVEARGGTKALKKWIGKCLRIEKRLRREWEDRFVEFDTLVKDYINRGIHPYGSSYLKPDLSTADSKLAEAFEAHKTAVYVVEVIQNFYSTRKPVMAEDGWELVEWELVEGEG